MARSKTTSPRAVGDDGDTETSLVPAEGAAPAHYEAAQRQALDIAGRYRLLAAELLASDAAWSAYMERCKVVAATEMYGYKKAEAVAIAGLKGFAMGWDLPAALERIKVIYGRPCIRGKEAVGLIRSQGFHFECVEATKDLARWECRRPGYQTKTFEYTRQKADRAGLPNKNDLWSKFPEELLKWACATMAANEYFPDILGGFAIAESYRDAIDVDVVVDGSASDSAPSAPVETLTTPTGQTVTIDARTQAQTIYEKVVTTRLAKKGINAVAGEEAFNKEKRAVWDEATRGMNLKGAPTDEDWLRVADRLRGMLTEIG